MMEDLTESQIISEFQVFDIDVKRGSTQLDRLREVGIKHHLSASDLCNGWVAFSTQHDSCDLREDTLGQWEAQLHRQTPASRRTVSKTSTSHMYTKENVNVLFEDDVDDLIGTYGTPEDKARMKGQKRTAEQTTPTTPAPKSRPTHNGATPITPASLRTASTAHTPLRSPATENGFLSSTPAVKYSQRKNNGSVVCTLNERGIPSCSTRGRSDVAIGFQDSETALKSPYQYMFQKVSDKALAVIDRIEELGAAICQHNSLPDPLPVSQPSLEPAVYVGQVVCEGEGHLNAHSCLLEGPVKSRKCRGGVVKLDVPNGMSCCLFPGQVIAVKGINNYDGVLMPSTIYDEGVFPPAPIRKVERISGFTMVAAAGPFTTSDSLDMDPLHDLLAVVGSEKPNVLVLFGPYVDATHEMIKKCNLPAPDMTFEDFFKERVMAPIYSCIKHSRTKLVMLPSQRDVHHPWAVYPQPPLQPTQEELKDNPLAKFAPDPATVSINGLCFGLTSTDVLFHLSARTMFRGPSGDRMARLAEHILRQQCYYPLTPPFRREDHQHQQQHNESESPNSNPVNQPDDPIEVNLDFIHAFDDRYALLPVRPDVLFLPSDLKPFAKRVEGCTCVNPGRLTKKASGGTFARIMVPDIPSIPSDFTSDITVQIVHI